MSLSANSKANIARNAALVALLLVVGRVGYEGALQLSREDPFKALRPRAVAGLSDDVGIRLENVVLKHYKGPKLITKATAGVVEVKKDRQSFELTDVTDGLYQSEKGPTKFSAKRGTWNSYTRVLNVTEKARVAGKDFDLKATNMTLDQRTGTLKVPKPMAGMVKGGQTKVANLTYNTKSGAFTTGAVSWQGELPQVQEFATAPGERSKWNVSADGTKSGGSKTNTTTYVNGTATDGEVLIKAPLLEHNTKSDVMTATGRVFYYSAKANLVADKVVVYRKEKRAVLSGTVIMLVKPKAEEQNYKPREEEIPNFKPMAADEKAATAAATNGPSPQEKELDKKLRSGNTFREYPMTVTSTNVVYWYARGNRRAKITGNPQARQEFPGSRWRHIWTHEALYDGEQETLLLESSKGAFDTRYRNSIGEDLVATNFLISTKEDDDSYEGKNIKGNIYADDEDVPKEKKPAAPAKPASGGGTKGRR